MLQVPEMVGMPPSPPSRRRLVLEVIVMTPMSRARVSCGRDDVVSPPLPFARLSIPIGRSMQACTYLAVYP